MKKKRSEAEDESLPYIIGVGVISVTFVEENKKIKEKRIIGFVRPKKRNVKFTNKTVI